MQNNVIRGCDAICSNQIALDMRFYSMTPSTHGSCTHNAVADVLWDRLDRPPPAWTLRPSIKIYYGFDLGLSTFSISMCFNSSTMYFQVHGTGILVAVVLAV